MAEKKRWKRGPGGNFDVWAWKLERTGEVVAKRAHLWDQRPPAVFARAMRRMYGPGKWVRAIVKAAL